MKHWLCPNCKRRSESEDSVLIVFCPCGYYMEEEEYYKEEVERWNKLKRFL